MAVSKANKETSVTSARNKIDHSNKGTKKEIKNPQSSVIISKPNYHHHYYQNIHSISSNSNYQTKKKNDEPSSNDNSNTHFTRQKRNSIDYDNI